QIFAALRATTLAPAVATCVQAELGSVIDFFAVSANLLTRLDPEPTVDLAADLFPHRPVTLGVRGSDREVWVRVADEPQPFAPIPPIGCARPPYDFSDVSASSTLATGADELPGIWDQLLHGIEAEFCGRWDKTGPAAVRHSGRAGPLELRWKKASTHNWAVAKRWMDHLARQRAFIIAKVDVMKTPNLGREEFEKTSSQLLNLLEDVHAFMRGWGAHPEVLQLMGPTVLKHLSQGIAFLGSKHFDYAVERAVAAAAARLREADNASYQAWQAWLRDAFGRGASGAHKASKVRPQQDVIPYTEGHQPYMEADRALETWQTAVWDYHQAGPVERPPDFFTWELLPPITIAEMRAACWSSPAKTATGPTSLCPKSLAFLSDAGLGAMARVFECCERLGAWPDSRIAAELVHLGKPDGGKRLIALLHSLTRAWGRARRPLGVQWERDHNSGSVWGNRANYTSSDCAFDLSLAHEMATLL
ncbi:unnamed protein product, partial [Prorocentrum cordatum]